MAFYKDPRECKTQHKELQFSSHYQQAIYVAAHYHEMIELQFFVKGEADVYIGNNLYKAEAGDLVVINSGEIHSMYSKKGVDFIVVQVDPEFLYTSDKTTSRIKYVYPFLNSNSGNPRMFKKQDISGLNIEQLITNILKQCTDMDFGFELSAKGDIYNLFFAILNYLKQQGKINDIAVMLENDTSNILYKVFEFVKNNYSSDITAKDAAIVANLSYSYFSRLFNSAMNMNFSEYLTSVRIARAEQLLIDTDKSMTQIAYECGFSTSSYFIMKFKQKNKVPPLVFRKKFGGVISEN